jgi:hypothetical protein
MSAIPYPASMFADEDAAYDDYVERVDNGEQCPDCGGRDITTEIALQFPLFVCRTCNCHWPNPFAPIPVLRCVYCGNEVSADPSPTCASCCGEVGHNQWEKQ